MTMDSFNLEGRISVGKSKNGDTGEVITLELNGRTVYQLQQLLESEAVRAPDYATCRWLVLLAEQVRTAVATASRRDRRAALDGQRARRLPERSLAGAVSQADRDRDP